ncbi:putative E3 ubiquitin-protein ligase RNF217 [Turdus rufiventris]|nr:putative E3 ubiquitin-protein ligase RNF217 [Turdus rufiventris]
MTVMVQSEIMSVLAYCDLMKWLKASETRGRILATTGTGVVWLDPHPNLSGPLSVDSVVINVKLIENKLLSKREEVQLGQADIKCPITECSEHLDETTVLYNLPHDDIIKYKYFLELSRIDSSTKPCPQCKHFTTFRRRGHIPTPAKLENKYKIQCPSCQFVWCFKCHSPWHEGVNCKEYKKGDKLLRHWANEIEHGQRNAQKCPKCKIHIQRTEGCDHMTCSQCNTNFCYRCGERYRQLRFFGDHTSNLSIFGCKYRYLPERPHLRRLVRGSVCGEWINAPCGEMHNGMTGGIGRL